MPHLTLEYTRNAPAFDAAHALREMNRALAATGLFTPGDIKSRATALDAWVIGTSPEEEDGAFLHVRLAVLAGRPEETRRALSDLLLGVLRGLRDWPAAPRVQLSIEVGEMDRASYARSVPGA